MSVKLTYYGHSTFVIDADGTKIVVDPFFAPNNPLAPAGATAETIEADFMLLTHGHGDHVADAVAIAKRTGCTVISNFEIVEWMAEQGVTNGHGMNTGGAYNFPFGRLKSVVALHSSTMPDGNSGGHPNGAIINFNDGTDIYFAGDTALTYDMRLIGEAGGVVHGPAAGARRALPLDQGVVAVGAALRLAKRVIPCHFNTFPPIRQNPDEFASQLADEGVECTVMGPGDEFEI